MKWTAEADEAVKKVPFFVRKKVRARVENEAQAAGKATITLADVKTTQARYLANMSKEIKGYQIDTCFGPGGCPNRANPGDRLLERIEELFKQAGLLGFLKSQVTGDLKFHHEFRVTLADCPNACSQPQIKDIGIIGACMPRAGHKACSQCGDCVEACKENAIHLDDDGPRIDFAACLHCGLCLPVCPTGTLEAHQTGYRVQLGGKLGRHPQLAREMPGIYDADATFAIVEACLAHYKETSKQGRRFALVMDDAFFKDLVARFSGSRRK